MTALLKVMIEVTHTDYSHRGETSTCTVSGIMYPLLVIQVKLSKVTQQKVKAKKEASKIL